MPENDRKILNEALRDAVREAKCPGAVAYIGRCGDKLFHESEGLRQIVPDRRRAEKDTIYDLASLTKVVATTTAVLMLHEEGVLDLDAPVSEYLPVPAFGRFTIRQCLTHTAGLHPGMPFYRECTTLNEMLQRYAATEPSREPGTRRVYSDVGFMILGAVVELASRDSLNGFCSRRIFRPLDMRDTAFNPPKEWADRCAATEQCAWRKRIVRGEVHDENAYAVGGVSGHAGLFSTAFDLAKFCRALLEGKLLKDNTVAAMRRIGQVPTYPWQGLGWKLDPWSGGSEGFLPSR
ncbi:MAG TPA: serine hydrolase domain-containing protein, partial [Candidatus Hydrogenedentes bacterium]|nr:serine hydrolase domain-containing protein [Candidatus Hydrogenedentota bacterium]